MLLLIASMIGMGLVAGWAAAGSIGGLKQIHLRMTWILFISVIVAVLPLFSDAISNHRRLIEIVSFGGVLLFLVVNILTSRGEVRAADPNHGEVDHQGQQGDPGGDQEPAREPGGDGVAVDRCR